MSLPYIPQIPNLPTQGKVNWKAVVFWAVLLGLIFAAVWWFYGPQITAWISKPELPTIDFSMLTLDNVVAFLKDYGFIISAGFAGATALYGLYQKHKANVASDAKAQLELQKMQYETAMNEQLKQAQSSASSYKYQYEQAVANNNTDQLVEAQNLVLQKEGEIKALQQALDKANEKLTSIPYRTVTEVK